MVADILAAEYESDLVELVAACLIVRLRALESIK